MSQNNKDKGINAWLAATLSTIIGGVSVFYLTEGRNQTEGIDIEPIVQPIPDSTPETSTSPLPSPEIPSTPVAINPIEQPENSIPLITINVSGVRNVITVEEGNFEYGQDGFQISGTNNSRVFFISKQQRLKLNVSGVQNTIYVSRSIARNIEIADSGVSNQLIYR